MKSSKVVKSLEIILNRNFLFVQLFYHILYEILSAGMFYFLLPLYNVSKFAKTEIKLFVL